ncbi:uncharacterized protein LOC116048234 [Sander lucioperca]|uniref:uncharacterized protein LOC116048234 n=1 Tax=Sander lucioperca TaxID=283035 RepID=UPI00125D26AB|nr:uncharacterized protein LOC116048234 [Sander lucioperca]
MKFCITSAIPTKTITRYPNSKPWITPHIKHALKEKQKAFKQKDWASLKLLNRQTKNDIIKAKMKFKDKLEREVSNMNTKQAFQRVKILTGQEQKQNHITAPDPLTSANTLNSLFAWLDTHDYSTTCEDLLSALPRQDPTYPPSQRRMSDSSWPDNTWTHISLHTDQHEVRRMQWHAFSIPSFNTYRHLATLSQSFSLTSVPLSTTGHQKITSPQLPQQQTTDCDNWLNNIINHHHQHWSPPGLCSQPLPLHPVHQRLQ